MYPPKECPTIRDRAREPAHQRRVHLFGKTAEGLRDRAALGLPVAGEVEKDDPVSAREGGELGLEDGTV